MRYIEIRLKKNPDVSMGFLWSLVYGKVHEVLYRAKKNGVEHGVSFPEYGNGEKFPLGTKLRIFGEKEELEKLKLPERMGSLKEYVEITSPMEVPKNHRFAAWRRYRKKKGSPQRARRYAKRHGISFEEAMRIYEKTEEKKDVPYFMHKSRSTGQRLSVFVEKREGGDNPVNSGKGFDSFGLSREGLTYLPDF